MMITYIISFLDIRTTTKFHKILMIKKNYLGLFGQPLNMQPAAGVSVTEWSVTAGILEFLDSFYLIL